MVFSSGASTTEMKSKWRRVAHCALTVAPSCSTSRLTSRIRAGLFLMVWTPSGVSVHSMMYVATEAPLGHTLRRPFYSIGVLQWPHAPPRAPGDAPRPPGRAGRHRARLGGARAARAAQALLRDGGHPGRPAGRG